MAVENDTKQIMNTIFGGDTTRSDLDDKSIRNKKLIEDACR